MQLEIIQFGKYKGQPIQVLQNDKNYTDWLVAQQWFKEKYLNQYTIVINNFNEPSKTPEHNKFQGLFLDNDMCLEVVKILYPKLFKDEYIFSEWNYDRTKKVEIKVDTFCGFEIKDKKFEHNGIDITFSCEVHFKNYQDRYLGQTEWQNYNSTYYHYAGEFKIEIKPTLSDEYPIVLRQMKASKSNVLIIGEYLGIGINFEQLNEFFRTERIRIIMISEILKNK